MSLSASNLSFSYHRSTVLDNVSCSFSPQRLHALLGVNGAGKSTLIRLLGRQQKPASGEIFLNNNNLAELSMQEVARRIAYLPQRHAMSSLTVADYLLLGRSPHISWKIKDADREIVLETLEKLQIDGLALRSLFELSGGELQKAALARALVQEPEVILLDEPTSNLDPKNQHEVMRLIAREVQQRGLTAIIAMHDLNLALRYATGFTLLKDRKILASGGREVITSENLCQLYGIDFSMQSFGSYTIVFPE